MIHKITTYFFQLFEVSKLLNIYVVLYVIS